MSYHPNDLVSDDDLIAYERTILTQFGAQDWQAKRHKAIEDWLFPALETAGFPAQRLRTRYAPTTVYGVTSSVYTDYTGAATTADAAGIPLATILAGGNDGLYVGSDAPFRGLSIRMFDSVNAVAGTLTVEAWCDTWVTLAPVVDGTYRSGASFGRGGSLTWTMPEDWVPRTLSASASLYWARVRHSAALTAATACGQVGVIRRSALTAPVTLRTLYYIFREARIQQEGPWEAKAEQYLKESEEAWQRVQPILGREFDVVTLDDQVDATEATQTSDTVTGGGWAWERA